MVPQCFEYIGSPSWVKAPPMFPETPDAGSGTVDPDLVPNPVDRSPCAGGKKPCSCVQISQDCSLTLIGDEKGTCPENCLVGEGWGDQCPAGRVGKKFCW